MRVLIVDDDRGVTLLVRRLLEEEGYSVDTAHTLESARIEVMVTDYDAVVLDLGLPDGNGVALIRLVRREARTTPILVLTSSSDADTTVRALDAGADDFVTKPVSFAPFKARVRALVRRGGAQRTEQVVVGNLLLNRLSRSIFVDGAELELTPREFSLIEHFLMRVGEVVTRTQLMEKVLDLNFDPGTNVIDVNVSRLRRKLRASGATATIESRRGIGYLLTGEPGH